MLKELNQCNYPVLHNVAPGRSVMLRHGVP